MTFWKRILLVLVTIVLCIGCDQATKSMVRSHLPRDEVLFLAGGALRVQYAENEGAVLSFEPLLPERWRGAHTTVGFAVFLGLLFVFLVFASILKPVSVVALSLLCGGGLSNLLDRVALGGTVVDFLKLRLGSVSTCIFNLADAAIVAGALLFAATLLGSLAAWAVKRRSV